VGSIYMNASDATNPSTLLGFGTWVAFGAGRVPVGIDAGDTDFDTAEETGGAKTHTLTIDEMPSHNHGATSGQDDQFGSHFDATSQTNNGTIYTQNTGGGQAHNNLQPYIVVHMWKRTV
jgi:microcystin-dependent protein